jgi:P-type Cu+ transporter
MPTQETNSQPASVPPAVELAISGMTCANCARHVTEAIQSVPGVHSASVNLDAQQAVIRWSPAAVSNLPAIIHAVEAAGYGAKIVETAHDHSQHKFNGWQINLWIGVLGTLPLIIGEWFFGWQMETWFRWFSFVLAGIVQIFAGAQFYRGAWRQLKVGSSNMDTLVALGSTTAFGYSLWALFNARSDHLYFMEAAAIITLITVGHWLEARMSTHASSALKSLLNLTPRTARRQQPDGSEMEINVAELKAGDLVIVKPGDLIPTDGEVVAGDSALDESMLTGESVPVDKTAKNNLYAGTVNLNGRLVMRVIATGESTALANIIAAVQRAQTSRANIQRLGDQVSSVFVPVIVVIAVSAGLWWGFAPDSAMHVHNWLGQFLWTAHPPTALAAAFIIAAAVLIVACPCAMGLATPAAIMAGTNAAARRGILIRDGVALERAGQVTAIVFDKTGTLTSGKPVVVQTWKSGLDVSIAAALARNSTHPISQAIAKISSEEIQFAEWQEVSGAGVQAIVLSSRDTAQLGSLHWLKESGVDLSVGKNFINEWSAEGATIVGLAMDKTLQGLFAVKDTVKPGAAQVVRQLQRQGLKVYLLTGDNALTAASIAKQIGISHENVFAEVRPEQKAEFVKKFQQRGEKVAFVGDGINDAPALEQADLGIAVSQASDVAREAADIILLKSEIEAVPEALGLARATLRTIKQNLFWAFFYNALAVPLAATGFMSPILCAAAMGLSDTIVIGNALRLRNWRQDAK